MNNYILSISENWGYFSIFFNACTRYTLIDQIRVHLLLPLQISMFAKVNKNTMTIRVIYFSFFQSGFYNWMKRVNGHMKRKITYSFRIIFSHKERTKTTLDVNISIVQTMSVHPQKLGKNPYCLSNTWGAYEWFLRTKVWEHYNPHVQKQAVLSLVKTARIYFVEMYARHFMLAESVLLHLWRLLALFFFLLL